MDVSMNPDFEWYKVFYHTAHEMNFTKAAENLFITQSAVSQIIKNLETAFGVPLFSRRPGKLALTREGEELFHYVKDGYRFFRLGEMRIHEMTDLEIGEIKIGVSDTICRYFLIKPIQRFLKLYPGVKISVVNRTSSGITALVKEGSIDFGIITLPALDENLEVRPFLTVEDIFVASNVYASLKNRMCSLHEIVQHPVLLLYEQSRTRQNLEKLFQSLDISVSSAVEFESIDLLVEFARIGAGIAHVLKESADDYINKGMLFQIKTNEKIEKRHLGICMLRGGAVSTASQEFIEVLQKKET